MSAPKKLQQDGELPKLKKLWPTLYESVQEYWREQFLSQRSQADIRRELSAKLKIELKWDVQLTRFRAWLEDQDKRDAQAERAQENERRLIAEHPDWSLPEVREEMLRHSYLETVATGNFELGLKTSAEHTKIEALQFDKEKFKEAIKTKLQTGLDAVAEAFKGNPEAMNFYQRARSMIEREMK
jgi:hypothetical protein